MGLYAFPCARTSKLNQQICISPAPGRSSKLTHTGVEIDTCAFQTGCQLSSAATGMSLELRFLTQFQWREAYVLDNWQLAELPQSGGREFDPRWVHDNLSVLFRVYMRFPVPDTSKLNQQICISPAPGRSSKLTHTGVEIDTCAFQTGCQLSSAATGMSLELRFLTQFQWREAYVLDNWQLAELPQSGGREFDPRRVHDNLSVPLWVYMRFPVPEHQN